MYRAMHVVPQSVDAEGGPVIARYGPTDNSPQGTRRSLTPALFAAKVRRVPLLSKENARGTVRSRP